MAHGDAREGEVKGKLADGVGSRYSSHYLGTWFIQHYYRWWSHLGCASSRLNWRPPCRFKWTYQFRRKTKSDFCPCAITFQLDSNTTSFERPFDTSSRLTRNGHKLTYIFLWSTYSLIGLLTYILNIHSVSRFETCNLKQKLVCKQYGIP